MSDGVGDMHRAFEAHEEGKCGRHCVFCKDPDFATKVRESRKFSVDLQRSRGIWKREDK